MHGVRMFAYLAAAISISPVRAQEAQSADCANPATQAAMNACAGGALKNADAEMNTVYRLIIARLKDSDETKQLLVASQLLWLQFRDAECTFSANGVKGGSIYPAIVQNCRGALAVERAKRLKTYLNCAEGDMGCPVPPN
jgi:uncharacterized protein YecT (DUF1311 family)